MRIPTIIALTLFLTQSQAPKGVIEGRVIRAGSSEPISDVLITLTAPLPANATSNLAPDVAARLSTQIAELTIWLRNLGGASQDAIDNTIDNLRRNAIAGTSRPVTALTDGSGHFSFRDLAPGATRFGRELRATLQLRSTEQLRPPLTKTINLQEGKRHPPEDLVMVKGSVVSGRIRDPNGQPISGMNVAVYRVTYNNGRKMWSIFNQKPTDDRGEYRIYWLSPANTTLV